MAHEVRGVVARSKGAPVSLETIIVPDPGPGEARGARSRPAGSATPTCTTARAASTTTSRSCSATRRPAWSRRSARRDLGGPGRLRGPQLAGRLRRVPVLPPGSALVLLRHPQRHPEDDPGRRHRRSPPPSGIGAFAEKTLVAAGQCTKVDPAARPEAVGLLGCGVMAGLGAAMFTGEVGPGDSVAVFGCGGVGCAAIAGPGLAGASHGHRRRPRPPQARAGPRVRGHPHGRRLERGRRRGHPGPDRRQRRRRLHRGGRQPGTSWSRPSTPATWPAPWSRWACPTPDMRIDLPMIEFFGRGGRLKPSWYGDCLPSPRLPDAGRPLPPGPARPRPLRVRDHRPRRRRGGLPPDGAGRGAALGGRSL